MIIFTEQEEQQEQEEEELVYTTAETMFTNVVDSANEILSYDVFFEIGVNIGQGLADGMESMIDIVSAAGTKLAQAAETATKTSLQVNSPSKVFRRLGNSTGEGFVMGIEDGFADVDAVMQEVLPDPEDYTQSFDSVMSASTNKQMNSMAELLSGILPQMNAKSGSANVNVTLQGDAAGVFKLVKAENQKLINSTGYHALA